MKRKTVSTAKIKALLDEARIIALRLESIKLDYARMDAIVQELVLTGFKADHQAEVVDLFGGKQKQWKSVPFSRYAIKFKSHSPTAIRGRGPLAGKRAKVTAKKRKVRNDGFFKVRRRST